MKSLNCINYPKLGAKCPSAGAAVSAISLLGLLCLALVPTTSNAALVVVPGGNATVEGTPDGSASYYPFGSAGTPNTQRYQQVYNGASFGFTGPQLITQITFRPDATYGTAFSTTIPNIQIDLSTSSKTAGNLSTTFANNVGADDTVVFGSGSLALSSSFTAGLGNTKAFDIIINLATPFLYDPSMGSLLMDVRLKDSGYASPVHYFDTQTSSLDGIARVSTGNAGNYLNTVADPMTSDTSGLVTQFSFSAVPEPGSYACLAGLSALGIMSLSVRRNRI